MRKVLLIGIAALVLGGCAGYCITEEQTGKEGYVVFEPWPHVLRSTVTAKNGQPTGYTFKVIYLPNRARSYRIKTWSGLSKADFKFDFQDGWMLTGMHDKGDNSGVLEAITGLIPKGFGLENAGSDVLKAEPLLYRMEFDDCGRICGLTPIRANPGGTPCNQRPCDVSPYPPPCPPPCPSAPPVR